MLLATVAAVGAGLATHRIDRIEVYGAPQNMEARIINLLSKFVDRSVLLFPVAEASQMLYDRLPIKKVQMAVRWPDILSVKVAFRQSRLWMLTRRGVFGLDEEGVRLDPPDPADKIPVLVEGCKYDKASRVSECSRRASALYRLLQMHEVREDRIGSILMEGDNISLLMNGPIRIRFGDDSRLSEKIQQMKRVVSWFARRHVPLIRLDLMDPEHPVARLGTDLIG